MTAWRYRPEVLARLAELAVFPRPHTRPTVARDYLKALYTMEIRTMRVAQQKRERADERASRASYAVAVIALREKYAILSVPVELWVER